MFHGLYSKDKQCDYYQEFHKEGELLVSFTIVLVRMLINYVLNCLLELDLTLRDERILVEEVYAFASDLIYEFFNTNYLFFYELFYLCCSKDFKAVVMVFQGKNLMGLNRGIDESGKFLMSKS